MTNRATTWFSRRKFFSSTGAAALSIGAASTAKASEQLHLSDYAYEVTRTEEEWRAKLDEIEYLIMREGKTEAPQSSPLWEETRAGSYHCKGCDLKSFDGRWKVVMDKGWVFFYHAEPDAVLMGIDGVVAEYGSMAAGYDALTEIHCRRCGSHLGHFLIVNQIMTHCMNGASLVFQPAAA
ncbi:MAG: peptide-methionine (R)-S-oxide reductase [Litoreibacter sp.]|uniref:peptide-methionine (R)-S-oxide reductase n=1 Tax=Litoreibacter sp. TaxID=1969459 RepID=UPI00329A0F9B